MAEETHGKQGLILPVDNTGQAWETAKYVGNLKKLSDGLDDTSDTTDGLELQVSRSAGNPGESIGALGAVQPHWTITAWSIQTQGRTAVLQIRFKRKDTAINGGNIVNSPVVQTQQRFHPIAEMPMTSVGFGAVANGSITADGMFTMFSTAAARINVDDEFQLGGIILRSTTGFPGPNAT